MQKAVQQQARTHQQHASQRDLRYDQRRANTVVFSTATGSMAAIFEYFLQIAVRHAQTRHRSEKNGCAYGNQYRPAERSPINLHHAEQRQRDRSLMCQIRDNQIAES